MEHMIMMRLMAVLSGMMLFASVAHAEPSSLVAFDLATIQLLRTADTARGEALAKESKCAKCHGDAGVSDDPDDVNIAGLRNSYIYKQLKDYQDRNRDDKDMYKKTRDLDDQQMADLAVWYASLEPAQPAVDRNIDPAVLRLVFHGDPTRMLKACASCHGRDGRGGQFDHPALAGQYPDYLVYTLTEFREDDRTNDIYSRMRHIAQALTEEEIEALAGYYGTAMPEEEE
jgi:cytochrome c553